MKLKDIPEILDFLPEGINLDADINDPIMPMQHLGPAGQLMPILHWACKNNYTYLIQMLITNKEKYDFNISALDTDHNTALYFATNPYIVETLVRAGIDLKTPLVTLAPVAGMALPLDQFLYNASMLPHGTFQHGHDFNQTKGVLAAVYERFFYATTLKLNETVLKSVASIVFQYANELSEITSHREKHELANLAALCQTAYTECSADNFLRDLHKSLGEKGLAELVALVKPENQTNPALRFSSPRQAVQVSTPAEQQPSEEATSSHSNAPKEEGPTQTTKPK